MQCDTHRARWRKVSVTSTGLVDHLLQSLEGSAQWGEYFCPMLVYVSGIDIDVKGGDIVITALRCDRTEGTTREYAQSNSTLPKTMM